MAPSQIDTTLPVKASLAIINEFIALMTEEEDVINRQDHARLKVIADRKQKLVLDYGHSRKAVLEQQDTLKSLPQDLRKSLREAEQKMQALGERNMRLLRSAISGTDNLLKSVVGIVRAEALPKSGYTNHKTQHLQLGKNNVNCPAVAASRLV